MHGENTLERSWSGSGWWESDQCPDAVAGKVSQIQNRGKQPKSGESWSVEDTIDFAARCRLHDPETEACDAVNLSVGSDCTNLRVSRMEKSF